MYRICINWIHKDTHISYHCFGSWFSKIPKLMKTLQIFRSFNYVKDDCQQFAETKTTPKISVKRSWRTCLGYLLLLFTAKKKLERLQFWTSSSFFKIWSACSGKFKAYFLTLWALYHLLFDLETSGVNQIIIWWLLFEKKAK